MEYDYTTYSTLDFGKIAGGLMAFIGVILLFSFALAVFMIVTEWKVFKKAGKEGWAALIPIYNVYVLFEITWGSGWYFLLLFLAIIPILGWIAVFVITVITYDKLSKAFGKSSGFTVGLLFLCPIFIAILAFDSSTYLGVPGKNNETTNANNADNNMNSSVNQAPSANNPEPVPVPMPTTSQEPGTTNINPVPMPTVENNTAAVTPPNQTENTIPQNTVGKTCQNCGTALNNGEAFCPNCGSAVK